MGSLFSVAKVCVVTRMMRLWLLVMVCLAVFCDNTDGGAIRVERDAEKEDICAEVVKKHTTCTGKAHEEYKTFFEKGDDGRPDWLARKTCNYMTESVEVCADILKDCYSDEEVTEQKDTTLKSVLEQIKSSIDEWDSEKCPPVKAYLDRQKPDETEDATVVDAEENEDGEEEDGENTDVVVNVVEAEQKEESTDGENTEEENTDNVDESTSADDEPNTEEEKQEEESTDAEPNTEEEKQEEESTDGENTEVAETPTEEENTDNVDEVPNVDENDSDNVEVSEEGKNSDNTPDENTDADVSSDTKAVDVPEDGAGGDENETSETDDTGKNTDGDANGDNNEQGRAVSKTASLTILLAIAMTFYA